MADPNSMRALAQALMQQQGGPQYRAPSPGAYGPMGAGMDSTAAEYNGPQNEIPGLPGYDQDGDPSAMSPLQPEGMEEVFQPDAYPAVDMLGQVGDGMSEEEDWTDTGMQQRFGVDPYGNPIPGTPQFPFKPGRR
jgi:hypothetical protein